MSDKIILVRILVIIDQEGNWISGGYRMNGVDNDPTGWMDPGVLNGETRGYWVEAYLPIPVIETVQGIVKDAT